MGDSCAKVVGHSHALINIRLSTFFFFFYFLFKFKHIVILTNKVQTRLSLCL